MPHKGKSTERIDGVVALIMAISRAMFGERHAVSKYETEGFVVL
jgi:phage terminase large subunit-like protein